MVIPYMPMLVPPVNWTGYVNFTFLLPPPVIAFIYFYLISEKRIVSANVGDCDVLKFYYYYYCCCCCC